MTPIQCRVSSPYYSYHSFTISHYIQQASTLSSQNPPSSGIKRVHDTGDYSTGQSLDILGANATEQHGIESRSGIHALDSGADTGRTTYGSSPLNPTSQQQYSQGMTTSQYDPSRVGEEGTTFGSGQQQYGLGQGGTGTGLGHHKVHHEGHLHGHGPSEAAKANCDLCTRDQAAGECYCCIFEKFSQLLLSSVRSYLSFSRHQQSW